MKPMDQASAPTGRPALSIVVLTYERAALLERCLASLARQTVAPEHLEIVVADDGSSDDTPDRVERWVRDHPNIRGVRHDHAGIPATRNLGLRAATADLVAFVADDYELPPDYAERVLSTFEQNPQVQVLRFSITASTNDLGAQISDLYYRASVLARVAGAAPRGLVTEHTLDASGAATFRRALFDRLGGFDESLMRAEDSEFAVRLRQAGVAIHFDPEHRVGHRYDPLMRDTVRKSWTTGWYRCLARRRSAVPEVSAVALGRQKTRALRRALGEARAKRTVGLLALALPGFLLFEVTNRAGYLASSLWHRFRSTPD